VEVATALRISRRLDYVAGLGRRAGLSKRVHAHGLRRTVVRGSPFEEHPRRYAERLSKTSNRGKGAVPLSALYSTDICAMYPGFCSEFFLRVALFGTELANPAPERGMSFVPSAHFA
jgi:hypothetical protein